METIPKITSQNSLYLEDLITKGNILDLLLEPRDVEVNYRDCQNLLFSIANDFIKGTKRKLNSGLEYSYKKATDKLNKFADVNEIATMADELANVNVSDIGQSAILPDLVMAVKSLVNFCKSRQPSTDVDPLFGDEEVLPSSLEQDRFLRVYNAAANPLTIIERVLDGSLMYEEVDVVNNLYPRLLKVFNAILLDELLANQPKDGGRLRLTYVQQKTLSKLTGKDIAKVNATGFRKIIQDGYATMKAKDEERKQQGTVKSPAKRMETGVNRLERGDNFSNT